MTNEELEISIIRAKKIKGPNALFLQPIRYFLLTLSVLNPEIAQSTAL